MYVSEETFVHLRQANEEQRLRELEYQRVARQRAAESAAAGGRRRGVIAHWFRPAPSTRSSLSHS
jgi:hypothetical protein